MEASQLEGKTQRLSQKFSKSKHVNNNHTTTTTTTKTAAEKAT